MKLTQSPIFGLLLPFVEQNSQSTCAFRLTSVVFCQGPRRSVRMLDSVYAIRGNNWVSYFRCLLRAKRLFIMKGQCLKIAVWRKWKILWCNIHRSLYIGQKSLVVFCKILSVVSLKNYGVCPVCPLKILNKFQYFTQLTQA